MRRLLPVVPAMLLAVLLLVPAAAAAAPASSAQADVMVLAAEGGEEGPAGPEPRGANDPDNSFAPSDYEPNFLINAAVGLTALLILLAVGLGGLYWLLVQRPREPSKT